MRHAILIVLIALTACASPAVDTATPNFNETRYTLDLDDCRGGTALTAAIRGFGGAVVGSFYGAAQGAIQGAAHGDSKEGAIIGVAVGSVVGFAAGAYTPLKQQKNEVRQCLNGKGYTLQL
jgi:hypothetical protein